MLEKRDYINLVSKIFSFVVNVVITFLVTSFVIENVGTEAYGFVGLANEFVGYMQIVTIALNSMAARFVAIEYEKREYLAVNQYYSSLLAANIIISVVVSILGGLVIINLTNIITITTENAWDVKVLWTFILLNFIITLIGAVFQVSTFCKRRLELEAVREVIASFIKGIILLICYWLFPAYIWYVGIATLVAGIYTLLYNIKYTKVLMPEVRIERKYYCFDKILLLLKSGSWNSLTQLGAVFSGGLDLLITNLFVGDYAMGIMSVAKTVPKYVVNLIVASSLAFKPNFVILAAKEDRDTMMAQLKSSIKFFSVFTIIPLVLIISIGKNIYKLWVPKIDTDLLFYITITAAIGYLAVMPFEAIWGIYTALNKLKISSIYLIVESFLNVGIELILIQFTENTLYKMMIIVGITSALMFVRSFIFFPIYTQKCLGKSCVYFYFLSIRNIVVFSALSYFGVHFMDIFSEYSWKTLVIGLCVIGLTSIFCCYWVLLSKEEREKINTIIHQKIKYKRGY